MGSYLRWLGRSRGQEGVLLGSYLRCLGRSRGENGVLVGSYLRCLGRFRGRTLFDAFGRDCVLLRAIGGDWRRPPPPIPPYARAFYTNFSLVSMV